MLTEPETPDQRRARQHATLHILGQLGLELAQSAHAQAKLQLATPSQARPKDAPDYAASFATLSRAVRQTIAIELRLDAPARARPSFRLATRASDPRRQLLRNAFHAAVPPDPQLRREIDATIDDVLDADPDQQTPIAETIATLCNTLSIDLDLSRVPDELLNFGLPPTPSRKTYPPPRAAP